MASDRETPSSLMLAENVKSAASSTVTITVAVSITSRVEAHGHQDGEMTRCVRW